MAKAKSGDYISQAYEDRIEISLAEISRSDKDEFALLGMRYIPATFKCELCGHEPCLYAYYIKNLKTDIKMTVGSECINHFKGKMNIDLASGLKKRVKSVIRKMRRYMKGSLDEEQYKDMPKEQKRILVARLFMKHQAMAALKGDDSGKKEKALLRKEDVLKIIEENPWVAEEATPQEEKKEVRKEAKAKKAKTANVKNVPLAAAATV
jgi:hypothetical protein